MPGIVNSVRTRPARENSWGDPETREGFGGISRAGELSFVAGMSCEEKAGVILTLRRDSREYCAGHL